MDRSTNIAIKPPPVGLRPWHIADAMRMQEIEEAAVRYLRAGKIIPKEWSEEYKMLYDRRVKITL